MTPPFRRAPDSPETAESITGTQRREVLDNGGTVLVRVRDESIVRPRLAERVTLRSALNIEATLHRQDPAHVRLDGSQRYALDRPDVRAEAVARSTFESDSSTLRVTITLRVTRDGEPFFSGVWEGTFPRQPV